MLCQTSSDISPNKKFSRILINLFTIVLVIDVVRTSTTSAFLIPSTSITTSKTRKTKITPNTMFLVPSQALPAHHHESRSNNKSRKSQSHLKSIKNNEEDAMVVKSKATTRRKKRNHSKNSNPTATAYATPKSQFSFKQNGSSPNINWRRIPMDHLRYHPNFEPLSTDYKKDLYPLSSVSEVSSFRQESWQWDALHVGRCTTSRSCSALGFLEPMASKELGIPRSLLRRGGMEAYEKLSEWKCALKDVDMMNEVLFTDDLNEAGDEIVYKKPSSVTKNQNNNKKGKNKLQTIWVSNRYELHMSPASLSNNNKRRGQLSVSINFAAKYIPRHDFSTSSSNSYRKSVQNIKDRYKDRPIIARMDWGNAQEATAILTALNYVYQNEDPNIKVKEVGMCVGHHENPGVESSVKQKIANGLYIGASPDAVLVYSDGRIEALEVKNHCPFVPTNYSKNMNPTHQNGDSTISSNDGESESNLKKKKKGEKPMFTISRRQYLPTDVPAMYVPQLMLEMYCLGPNCRSAMMVRQTATRGAVILRLHRDDEWIEEMLEWLSLFKTKYVDKEKPPPFNFFWKDEEKEDTESIIESANEKERVFDSKRYREFVKRTKEIGDTAEVVANVPHKMIQRVMSSRKDIPIPLFLDDLS